MSKAGSNTTPVKQDMNPYKKDNRGSNSSNNANSNVNTKRNSGNFTPNQPSMAHGQHNRDRNEHKNSEKREESKNDDREKETGEKKFTGRCRLFVGNLTSDVTENDFRKMFEQFGEISEVYVNTGRGFGFIRLDYRQNAEAAKAALDGLQRKGRILRVRFATHGAALKVKNLHPNVSNELLEQSFSQFGDLERCVVIVDDRGKPTGEGIVEFARKPGYMSALRRITEGVFLIGADPKPVGVEPLEQKDEEDGMPEKFLTKTEQYKKEREKEPRFAPPGTFEYEFGMRWKQLEEVEKQRIEQIKKDTDEARLKLEDEMQTALYEYQAEQIRQEVLRQQEELRRLEELKNNDRMRRQQEMEMRRQQDDRNRDSQELRRRSDMFLSMKQHEIATRGRMDSPAGMRGRDEMMMPDRFGDRMPDRMSDRMPERMGDRLGDRMADRMGDRMGPNQPGFMWDEKQQREASMRNEAGRGRDMRGAGASPLQPPTGPSSNMDRGMDRSGPGLMERGGPGPMERGGPMDRGPMDRVVNDRSVTSVAAAAVAAAAAVVAQGVKASPKPLMQGSGPFPGMGGGPQGMGPNMPQGGADAMDMFPDNNQQQICECETMKEPKEPVGEKPEMSIPYEEESVLTTNTDLPKELNSEKERVSKVNTHPSCSTFDEDQMETDDVSKKLANSDNVTSDSLEEHLIRTDRNENHFVSTPEENRENVTGGGLDFNSSTIQASNAFVATADDKNSIISTHIPSAGVKQVISSENKHILSSTESEICELLKENYNQPPDSSDEVERDKSHCQFYSESYQIQSTTNLQDNSLCTTANKTPVTKICDKCTVDDQFKHSSCPLLQSSNPTLTVQKSGVADTVSCISHENNNVLDTETVDKRIFEEDKSENSSIVDRDQYEEDPLKGCSYIEEEALSSYKQHSNDQMEVDNESYDEETGRAFVSPSIYQSYEENPLSAHFQTSDKNESLVVCPIIAEYNTCSGESSVSSPELRPPVSINNVEILLPNASAHTQTSTHNILNETAESFLPSGVLTSSTSSSKASVSLSISSSEEASQIFGLAIDEHEGALCTGDQNFKTSAACQTPLVPLMHSNQTCPTVSCVNQPAFKAVMNRGIPQQTLLTSALHFAQHQARCNSVMGHHRASVAARSTVLQQHVGATAMFHQRTMTNDGRTLLLQQSTMTTSQGAVAQQALLQQRLAAQTVLHQTSISRHQAVQQSMLRLPGRQIVDATLYPKTQSTIIAGGANALTGQRLIQSGSQNQLMQHFARQRYLGGPIVPQQRRVQMVTGGPMRIKMAYPRWTLTMDSNT